jgi:probable rRNA maturation factor
LTEDPSKPTVIVSDRQGLAVPAEHLVDLAISTLRSEGVSTAELSVSLVEPAEMADLHERYMGESGPTDVLSFPQDDEAPPGQRRLLGDVVICPAMASERSGDLQAEIRLLLVHGILHLLGYDHQEDEERKAMWERQEAYSGVRIP